MSDAEDAPPGYTVGPCIGGRVGHTRVFAGLDAGGTPVALKTLAPSARDVPLRHARFVAECAMHAQANGCDGVVPLTAVQPDGWLVMHWAHGGTLDDWMARDATFAPTEVRRVVGALLAACAGLAHRRLVHRDIKPSNVLLDGPRVWLADFGIAAHCDDDGVWRSLPAPWTETEVGTAGWVAPELVQSPLHISTANDVYSVGRVWEVLLARSEPDHATATIRTRMIDDHPASRPSAADVLSVLTAHTNS
jgi:serine/threonine protein kinase